jgi:hypothetical protein
MLSDGRPRQDCRGRLHFRPLRMSLEVAALTYPQVLLRIAPWLRHAKLDVRMLLSSSPLSFSKESVCRLLTRVLAGFS